MNQLRGVLNRYATLAQAYAQQPVLTAQVVSNLKVLLGLRGDALQSADRTYIESLYSQLPLTLRRDCGASFTPPTGVPPTCDAAVVPINGEMEMCQEMLADYATPAALGSISRECLNVVDRIVDLSDECRRDDYRSAYVTLAEAVTSKRMTPAVAAPGSAAQLNEIKDKLAALQAWFTKMKQAVYPQIPIDDALLAQTARLLKAYWQPLYLTRAGSLQVSTPEQAEAARTTVLNDGLTADLQTLKAAYGAVSSPPLTSAPLLMITADAFKGIEERALSLSVFNDMVCPFKPCSGRVTSTSGFLTMLSSLHSGSLLSQKLTPTVRSVIGSDWSTVFDRLASSSGHQAFESAFKDAQGIDQGEAYDSSLLLNMAIDELSVPAKAIAQILRGANVRTRAYDANGVFDPSELKHLKIGLDRERQDAILAELNRIIVQLQQSVGAYRENKLMLVRGLVDQIQNQSIQDSLRQRAERLLQKIADLTQDMSGLQTSSAVDEARYSQFMKGFEAISDAITQEGQRIVKSQGAHDVDVSPGDIIFLGDRTNILNMAVRQGGNTWKLTEQTGDMINFYVSGRWAPNCALSQVSVGGAPVRVRDSQDRPIFTGPEGYSLQEQQGSFYAQSNQTVTTSGEFTNFTRQQKVCAGGGLSLQGETVFIGLGSAESCMIWAQGETWSRNRSQSGSDGAETRSTFSYARGIRSGLAPFQDQPVGSLLLVQLPPGETNLSVVRSVRALIAPQTSVLVNSNSDYYLVVNDSSCIDQVLEPLSVRVTELRAAGPASQAMAEAMAAATATIRERSEGIIAQGRILPGQLDLVRRDAYQELYRLCGCSSLAGYADSLRNLFETFIEKELVHISREVDLVNIERQVRETMMEVQTLRNELEHAESSGRLAALIPAWALRDLDGLQIKNELNLLGQMLREWIYPVVILRNPETIGSFTPGERATLDRLTSIGITSDLDQLAYDAITAAQTIENRLRQVRAAAPRPVNVVIFSIPKPGYVSRTNFWKVDSESATRFWQEVLANKDTNIGVKPEYFYTNTDPYFLPCNYSAPIVNSAVLYLVHPPIQTYPRSGLTATVSPEMRFPLVSGLEEYKFAAPTYLGPFVQVLTGGFPENIENQIRSYWAEPGSQVATGISPLTDWHLDFTPFRNAYPSGDPDQLSELNPWRQAEELLVAFRVEPRAEAPGQPLPGVATCP